MRRILLAAAVLLLIFGARALAQQAPPPVSLPLIAQPAPTPTLEPTPEPLPTPAPEAWRRPGTPWVQLDVVDVVQEGASGGFYL